MHGYVLTTRARRTLAPETRDVELLSDTLLTLWECLETLKWLKISSFCILRNALHSGLFEARTKSRSGTLQRSFIDFMLARPRKVDDILVLVITGLITQTGGLIFANGGFA